MLHVVVVCMQAHTVVLQSLELAYGTRTARIYVAVSVLIFDVVVDIRFSREGCQFGRRLVKHSPHLRVNPLKRLVGLTAIGIEVLINTAVH